MADTEAAAMTAEEPHEHDWYRCYGGLSPEAAAEHGIKPHWFCQDCMFDAEPPEASR